MAGKKRKKKKVVHKVVRKSRDVRQPAVEHKEEEKVKKNQEQKEAVPSFPSDVTIKNLLLFDGRFDTFRVGETEFRNIMDFMNRKIYFWDEDLYGEYIPQEQRSGYVCLSHGWGAQYGREVVREDYELVAMPPPVTSGQSEPSKIVTGSVIRKAVVVGNSWLLDSRPVMTEEQFNKWMESRKERVTLAEFVEWIDPWTGSTRREPMETFDSINKERLTSMQKVVKNEEGGEEDNG